ncbi:MAG TPA: primosomal protein N' [Tepidisphaeraceae bacterium]|nr:primosomal protein N' [Tepidisphaeraceae bacterium]
METLFGQLEAPATPRKELAAKAEGPFAAVAMEHGIDRLLDYSIPPGLRHQLRVGQVVRVPLGRSNRTTRGYVISIHEQTDYPRIKPLSGIDDERVLIPPELMQLALWMSRYYVAALGTVLESVIPSAVKKRVGLGYSQMVRLAQPREKIQELLEKTKAPKRRAVLARLLLLEPDHTIELNRLAGESGTKPPTVRKLVRLGLISIKPEADLPRLTESLKPFGGDEPDIPLNGDQQKVLDELAPRMAGGFSVSLLHGVTGSGKTEVYLRCIREVVQRGKQAIVLVPEISLTPQTVRRFTGRFRRVAILHSGLTATERHRFWQMISNGMADVVVGARSAIFAPLPNLGVVVVDEEHEASYKQDQVPRYHARDVAIKRGQLEGVPVLLGSATPSLESYAKVVEGATEGANRTTERRSDEATKRKGSQAEQVMDGQRPRAAEGAAGSSPSDSSPFAASSPRRFVAPSAPLLLSLPNRVRGLAMPHVELIDMKVEGRFRRGVHLLSQRLEHLLRATLEAKRQAILLLNRRGYSNFVYCVSCQNVIQCKYCDTTMTYHRAAGAHAKDASSAEGVHTGHLHCHYCLAVNPLPDKCPACAKKLSLFGLGTQRVEEEITRKFPDLVFARVDSDSMRSSKDYEQLLGRFAEGEIQVLLGTQMIAKGLDYPNVTLVGVISGDTALALPDFRAAERTFQLITQVAGRAGRGDAPGRVVLQTFIPDDPTIQAAIKQDFVGFARTELKHRREIGLPPFARMVRIVLRDQEEEKLQKYSEELAAAVAEAAEPEGDAVKIKGPMPCAINRIAGYYRNQLVMLSPQASRLQRILARVRKVGGLSKTERIAVDVDPVSLL